MARSQLRTKAISIEIVPRRFGHIHSQLSTLNSQLSTRLGRPYPLLFSPGKATSISPPGKDISALNSELSTLHSQLPIHFFRHLTSQPLSPVSPLQRLCTSRIPLISLFLPGPAPGGRPSSPLSLPTHSLRQPDRSAVRLSRPCNNVGNITMQARPAEMIRNLRYHV